MNVGIDSSFNSPIAPFEQWRIVVASEIDQLNHVNNVVYLAWINEIAVAHWNSLTTEAIRSKLIWVALRHEIDYKAEAVLGDRVLVRTWTGQAHGLRYSRHTRIYRGRDQTLLAQSNTDWCPIGAATRKPIRPPEAVVAMFAKS